MGTYYGVVMFHRLPGTEWGCVQIGPSVTPLTNLNSGFRVYEVDSGVRVPRPTSLETPSNTPSFYPSDVHVATQTFEIVDAHT